MSSSKPISRSTSWRIGNSELRFDSLPVLMGIVNVTPDSFSDGGNHDSTEAAVSHALQLAADGAGILDIGGESTRPYSQPVSSDDELARVIPVIEQLVSKTDVPISIDTSKSAVAQAAVSAGATIINDVTGFEDPKMIEIAKKSQAGICAMHMQGNPQTMQDDPQYKDVVADILKYLKQRKEALLAAGIEPSRICLDPGIGFGKTHEHNLELVAAASQFHSLGCPVLVGHSRKGFIKKICGEETADRDIGSLAVTLALAQSGIQIIRVHEVRNTMNALKMLQAVGGIRA